MNWFDKLTINRELFIFVSVFIFATNIANAQVVITEIMYDLEGTDTDREWVEIFNTGSSAIDLTGWKFNDGSNHILNVPPKNGGQGVMTLMEGKYAILTDNAVVFLSEYTGFSKTVIDTVMSLGQQAGTSYTLQVLNDAGVVIDEAVYDKSSGANGDGNSLQKIGSSWVAAWPTPGEENFDSGEITGNPSPNTTADTTTASAAEDNGEWHDNISTKLTANAGKDKTVLAGSIVDFEGLAQYSDGTLEGDANFLWSFGDGEIAHGKKVAHTFLYPGTYSVYLDVSLGDYSAADSLTVAAIESPLEVSAVSPGKYIEIFNNSARAIDISRFGIKVSAGEFFFPVNTYISPRAKIPVSLETLGFAFPVAGTVELVYPNGKVLLSQVYPKPTNSPPAVSVKKSPPPVADLPAEKVPEAQKTTAQEQTGSAASVLNPIKSNVATFGFSFIRDYFWLIVGLATGAVVGLLFVLIKRFLRYN